LVALAMVLGIVAAALSMREPRLRWQVLIAALIISAGAFLDSGATSITRPPELYLSQAMIGFGTTLFVGPALVFGFSRMFAKGANYLVSFVVMFSITQNVGGLAGSALLGTYQVIQTHAHAAALYEKLDAADPLVTQRLQLGAELLQRQLLAQANILAFNDVFRLVSILALTTAAYILYLIIIAARRERRVAQLRRLA
jgi:hypothetical protein